MLKDSEKSDETPNIKNDYRFMTQQSPEIKNEAENFSWLNFRDMSQDLGSQVRTLTKQENLSTVYVSKISNDEKIIRKKNDVRAYNCVHTDQPHEAKGMCTSCYSGIYRK